MFVSEHLKRQGEINLLEGRELPFVIIVPYREVGHLVLAYLLPL